MMEQSVVLAQLPRGGLANKLLVWSHAYAFATNNNLPLYESSWSQFLLGPILRAEKSKRFYLNSIVPGPPLQRQFKHLKRKIIPKSDWTKIDIEPDKVYEFSEVPQHQHYFELVQPFRAEIQAKFYNKVKKNTLEKFKRHTPPEFSIHIRLGDFKNFPWTIYDWLWYENLIHEIRAEVNYEIPITIFSDGSKDEIPLFDKITNINYWNSGNDLLDLLILSKSKILVTYPGSTFGLWAGFTGDSILIHQNETEVRSRLSNEIFEGTPFDECDKLKAPLINQLLKATSFN